LLLVVGCWLLLVVGCWWLLVVVVCCWLLVVVCCWLLVVSIWGGLVKQRAAWVENGQNLSRSFGDFAYKKDKTRKARPGR